MEHECSEKTGDTAFLLLCLYFFTTERATLSRLLNDHQLTNVIIVQKIQTKQQHCQNYIKAMKKWKMLLLNLKKKIGKKKQNLKINY